MCCDFASQDFEGFFLCYEFALQGGDGVGIGGNDGVDHRREVRCAWCSLLWCRCRSREPINRDFFLSCEQGAVACQEVFEVEHTRIGLADVREELVGHIFRVAIHCGRYIYARILDGLGEICLCMNTTEFS